MRQATGSNNGLWALGTRAVPGRQVVLLGPSQVKTCDVVPRPVPGGGSRLSLEKARTQRVAGGGPPPPFFRARSFHSLVLAWWGRSGAVRGLFRNPCTCPDLETFFHKNAFQHIFSRKCVPNRFWHIRGNSPSTVAEITTAKTSEWERAAIKNGVQGLAPGVLSPDFLQRKSGSPAGVGGPPGRCAPRHRKSPTHPKGTLRDRQTPSPPCYRGPASRQGAGRANPWSMGPAPCPRSSMAPRAPER